MRHDYIGCHNHNHLPHCFCRINDKEYIRMMHLATATSFLLQNFAFLAFVAYQAKKQELEVKSSKTKKNICCICFQVGLNMWQLLDLGTSFFAFCGMVGGAGILSFLLTIFHLYISPV